MSPRQNHSLPSWASCASIDALSPLRIRSNSVGQTPVTNAPPLTGATGVPPVAGLHRCGFPRSPAFSPVAADRVRRSFSRRTLFSMYESTWIHHYHLLYITALHLQELILWQSVFMVYRGRTLCRMFPNNRTLRIPISVRPKSSRLISHTAHCDQPAFRRIPRQNWH